MPSGDCPVRYLAVVVGLFVWSSLASGQLQTVAERTNYEATSRYEDVVAFCQAIAKQSQTAKFTDFGTTHEGRKLPLLTIANPPVSTPEEARKNGRLVVLAFANIHAGEVDGKEALLALARDLTAKPEHPLLKDLVILLAPIFNADGNEKIGTKNRPGQNGPRETGIRANAQGFDLNRDFVKLESPEVRALVGLFNHWDPAVIIDCHTTNGSKHRHTLTYDGPRYPSHDIPVAEWANTRLFPLATKRVKELTGFDLCPYGNFNGDRTRWESYPASPRYGVQYIALRGRVGILSESYSYASFKDRTIATHAFVTACLEVVAQYRDELVKVIAANPGKRVPLRTQVEAFPDKIRVNGYEEVEKDGRRIATDQPKEYTLAYHARCVPQETVELPSAYLIPVHYEAAADTLRRHGIQVEELREDIELDVAVYTIRQVDRAPRPFQNHQTVKVELSVKNPSTLRQKIPAGTYVVKTDQPLGRLAAYLLEPLSEDGLTTWNFFDRDLQPGSPFPVVRVNKTQPMLLGPLAPLPEHRVTGQPITEEVLASGVLQGQPATIGAWIDADHFLQVKEGQLLKVEARTGQAEPFTNPELIKKSLAALKEVPATTADQLARSTTFRFNPNRTAFLFNIGPDLGLAYLDGRPAIRLTRSEGTKQFVTFSPDGRRIAYVRGDNLYTVDTENPEEKQLTFDGGDDILNGKADWVYFEEIFLRNGQAFWWSPDSKSIAFMRFDDTPVRRFHIVAHNEVRGRLESQPYPKAGDPNPLVRIGVVSATGGSKPQYLAWGDYPIDGIVVSRVGWMPDSKGVFAYVQNRTQTWLDFVTWPDPLADPKALFRETTKAWVEDLGPPHFLPDGSFLILSERSGWKHLYHYAAEGRLLNQVTAGRFEVQNVLRVDPKAQVVYFTGSFGGPSGTHLYGANINGNKPRYRLTQGGHHQVTLAPEGPLLIDRFTDDKTPMQTRLEALPVPTQWPTQMEDNKVGRPEDEIAVLTERVRILDTNPVRAKDQFKFGKYERVQIPTKDGFELEAAITYPPNFDPKKKYPIWVLTYAGPHAPTIRTGWAGGRGFEQTLATNGIIAFRVDPRSASGKGAESAWTCYKQLGVQELKDLEEAVTWLCRNEWADASRVGISGHSYGGFMTAYALTHSKTFRAGIAGSGVMDWKLYDSIYTERYMLTPKENPDGYAKTSCIAAAKNLTGQLLITHGMMDDNVHLQNSVQMIDALQRANKDFEMMFYPQARHGTGGPHYTRLQLDFIRRTMGVKP
jgi:dipeptidyl aminopeptidase/acylaminoacyl peptidase